MMKLPNFATHYYLPETGPFRSLSELPAGSEDPVFLDILTRHQRKRSTNPIYAGFA